VAHLKRKIFTTDDTDGKQRREEVNREKRERTRKKRRKGMG